MLKLIKPANTVKCVVKNTTKINNKESINIISKILTNLAGIRKVYSIKYNRIKTIKINLCKGEKEMKTDGTHVFLLR